MVRLRPNLMKLREAARGLRFPESPRQTIGRLLSADGSVLPDADQLWSGRKGPADGMDDIRTDLPNNFHRWATVWTHVESHAAAWIRRQRTPQHVVLLVSKDPCDDSKFACRTVLPKILPRGSSLTIFTVKPDGSDPQYFGTYNGTGEGLK